MGTPTNIALRLFDIYNRQGFQITSELNSEHVYSDTYIFTRIYQNNRSQTHHLGIAMREVHFLESLCSLRDIRNIFVIGNSFAFSTFALALINPQAKVVAIEIGDEDFTAEWIDRTNRIAREEGLNITVIKGSSPENNADIINREFDGRIDLAFVDGLHTTAAVEADFESLIPFGHDETMFVFHDVLSFSLTEGLSRVVTRHPMDGRVFFATPSGMAVVQKTLPPNYDIFSETYGCSALVQIIINAYRAAKEEEEAKRRQALSA
ncbi:class I SAM-dependent methyltransferase [Niveispirillum sp. KHB5.9]|uniref:class I SAM-dependent methyltransferase n=1 Tax=Niveispirillum sp. KHB5.9 TaxID=3400269 RepID=UPI003A8A7081